MIEKQEENLNKQKTLAIIKPDAIKNGLISEIISRINKAGLEIIACKMEHLSKEKIEEFYSVHADRPFFRELVDFMLSGHVMLMVLHGENAVNIYRNIMGDTNPKNAAKGTIRGDLADSIDANCVHGSDSVENAKIEISLMFNDNEIFG